MAQTAETRKIFIDSMVKMVTDHNFDGVDLDWEYPGSKTVLGNYEITIIVFMLSPADG